MSKRFWVFLMVLLLCSSVLWGANEAKADGDVRTGIVTSTRVSVRKEPDENASRYKTLNNGDTMMIVGETYDWYIIDLSTIGAGEGQGYALKKYIHPGAYYITLTADVTLWADTWGSGVSNGSKTKNTTMLVLSENADWYCVQTCDKTAGSSFIKKADLNPGTVVVQPSSPSYTVSGNQCVVTCKTLAVRMEPDDNQKAVGFLHRGDVVTVIQKGDYFTSIQYTLAGQVTECWVHSQYLNEIVN